MKRKTLEGCRATRWLLLLLTFMMGQTIWAEATAQAPDQLSIECYAGVEVLQSGLITDGSIDDDIHYQQMKGWGCKAIYKVGVDRLCTENYFYLSWKNLADMIEPAMSSIRRMPAPRGFYDDGGETTLYDENGNKVKTTKPGYPYHYGPNDDIVIYINGINQLCENPEEPEETEETLSGTGINCYIGFKNVNDANNTLCIDGTDYKNVEFVLQNNDFDQLSKNIKIYLYGDEDLEVTSPFEDNIMSMDCEAKQYEDLWFTIECDPGYTVTGVNGYDGAVTLEKTATVDGKTYYEARCDYLLTNLCNRFDIFVDYTQPQAPDQLSIECYAGVEVLQSGLITDGSIDDDIHYQQMKGWGCKAIYKVGVDRLCTENYFYLSWKNLADMIEPAMSSIRRMPAPRGFYDDGGETTLYDENGNKVKTTKPGYPYHYGPNDDIVIYINGINQLCENPEEPEETEETLSGTGINCYIGFKNVNDANNTLCIDGTDYKNVEFVLQNNDFDQLSKNIKIYLYGDEDLEVTSPFEDNIMSMDCEAKQYEDLWFTIECDPGYTVTGVNGYDGAVTLEKTATVDGKTYYEARCDYLLTNLCNRFDIFVDYTQPQDADFVDLGLPSGTKWAKYNIEATSPEGIGEYYAWGEKEAKKTYTWKNYKYCSGTASSCKNIGDDISKTPAYDIAYSLYQEVGASIPTSQQWEELFTVCTWKESKVNGVKGYTVTGPNGQSIFLPFAGCSYDGKDYGKGTYAYYWTANNVSGKVYKALAANIQPGVKASLINLNRRTGVAIRPVIEPVTEESNFTLVDLGLSVKWASKNLGAAKESAYGDYYAWGETETKNTYTWKNYEYANGSAKTAQNIGASISQTSYDAAYENNDGLAMPTAAQWKELIDKCTWKEDTKDGIKGFRVTGPSGKSIFLPFSGCSYDGKQMDAGASAYYWTSDNYASNKSKAKAAYLKSAAKAAVNIIQRRTGAAIRPVECTLNYVDLDLPSGNLWSTCNLGANSEAESGNYYSWGEKAPKTNYTWKSYRLSLKDLPMLIGAFWTCDLNAFELEDETDAPYDPSCRKMVVEEGPNTSTYIRTIPTKRDFQELIDNCTIEEKTVQGTKGLRITGPNGNKIFMPYAGSCYDGKTPQSGTLSYYWTCDRYNCINKKANALNVQDGQATFTQCQLRTGLPIRPLYMLVNETTVEFANSGYADGINDIEQAEKSGDAIYNLQGIKMEGQLRPGIYIRNGKKFVVK